MPWNSSLSVGIDLIDDQHKEWFAKAEALFDAGRKGRGKEQVGEMLQFLDSYTRKHFADEEKYMKSIAYPGLTEQQKAHASFIAQLEKLRQDYDVSGGSLTVVLQANKMVIDWLTQHISLMDKKIGEFAKQK
jgi:hemerythrin